MDERTEDQEWIAAQATIERLWRAKQQHFQSKVREVAHLESQIDSAEARLRELESALGDLETMKQQLASQQLQLEAKTNQIHQLETQLRNLPKAPEASATEIKVLRDRLEMKDRQIADLTRQRNLNQRKDENNKSVQEKEVERLKTLLAFRDADLKQIEWQKAQEKAMQDRQAMPERTTGIIEHRSPTRQIRLPIPASTPRQQQAGSSPVASPTKQPQPQKDRTTKEKAKERATPTVHKLRKNILRDSQSMEEDVDLQISQLLRPASSPKKGKANASSSAGNRRKSVFYVPVQHSVGGLVKGFNITVEADANSQYQSPVH